MSAMKLASNDNSYKSSSMKSVLTLYGLKDQRHEQPKSVKSEYKRENASSAKKKKQFFEETIIIEDTSDIVERKKEKDKRVLQLLTDMQRLRYYYYLEYKERLVDKVEKQREEAQKLKEREEKIRQAREARKAREAHRLKRRFERIPLQHDEEYLKNMPKTNYYRIVQEENRLHKEGKLKTREQTENFWNNRLYRDAEKEKAFAKQHSYDGSSSCVDTEAGDQPTQLPRHLNPLQNPPAIDLDRISEGDERSRPSTKRMQQRGKSFTKKLEALFPKMEMPPLHVFDMDLSQKVDEEEEKRLKEITERLRQREARKAMYNRMFHLALTHNATAKRIIEDRMDETSLMIFQREFTNLGDLFGDALQSKVASAATHAIERPEDAVMFETEVHSDDEGAPHPLAETSEEAEDLPNDPQHDAGREDAESQKNDERRSVVSAESTVNLPKSPEMKKFPLTMQELASDLPTMTPVKPSSLWTNYMKSGSVPPLTFEEDPKDVEPFK